MPRHASRILLEATVRVERLQEISAEDMIVEGCESGSYGAYYPVENYARLWQSINDQGSWDLNPWVWIIESKSMEKNNTISQ